MATSSRRRCSATVDNASELAQHEVFGPVLSIVRFADEDEAVELANGTDYGLGGLVYTNDIDRAHRLAKRLRAGSSRDQRLPADAAQRPVRRRQAERVRPRGRPRGSMEFLQAKNVYIYIGLSGYRARLERASSRGQQRCRDGRGLGTTFRQGLLLSNSMSSSGPRATSSSSVHLPSCSIDAVARQGSTRMTFPPNTTKQRPVIVHRSDARYATHGRRWLDPWVEFPGRPAPKRAEPSAAQRAAGAIVFTRTP